MKLFEAYANVYRIAMFQRSPMSEMRRQGDCRQVSVAKSCKIS